MANEDCISSTHSLNVHMLKSERVTFWTFTRVDFLQAFDGVIPRNDVVSVKKIGNKDMHKYTTPFR